MTDVVNRIIAAITIAGPDLHMCHCLTPSKPVSFRCRSSEPQIKPYIVHHCTACYGKRWDGIGRFMEAQSRQVPATLVRGWGNATIKRLPAYLTENTAGTFVMLGSAYMSIICVDPLCGNLTRGQGCKILSMRDFPWLARR